MIILLIGLLAFSVMQNIVYYRRSTDFTVRVIDLTGYPPVGEKK
jgi:hypothetical protein